MKNMKRFAKLMTAALTSMTIFLGSAVSAEAFSFADLSQTQFAFSSGAGAWETGMVIAEDGSFSGQYHDSDMGSNGDGYDATVYMCDFHGNFVNLTQVDENSYETNITGLKIKKANGTTEIKDRTLYSYSLPYGLLDEPGNNPASKFTIYMKGTPVSELPESFYQWALTYRDGSKTVLEDYCIRNNDTDTWFIGYQKPETQPEPQHAETPSVSTTAYPEPWNTKLNNALTLAAQTEAEMNAASSDQKQYYANQLYLVWDNLLNEIWQSYPQSTKDNLLNAQLEWIYAKEAKQAQYNYTDGLIYAASQTKDRVYVLLQYV